AQRVDDKDILLHKVILFLGRKGVSDQHRKICLAQSTCSTSLLDIPFAPSLDPLALVDNCADDLPTFKNGLNDVSALTGVSEAVGWEHLLQTFEQRSFFEQPVNLWRALTSKLLPELLDLNLVLLKFLEVGAKLFLHLFAFIQLFPQRILPAF